LRGERHALGVIACRCRDYAARQRRRRQARHLVVSAAQLEREHRLHVFALEQEGVVEPCRQIGRALQRRFDGHVINARGQDALEIIDFHGMDSGAKGRKE